MCTGNARAGCCGVSSCVVLLGVVLLLLLFAAYPHYFRHFIWIRTCEPEWLPSPLDIRSIIIPQTTRIINLNGILLYTYLKRLLLPTIVLLSLFRKCIMLFVSDLTTFASEILHLRVCNVFPILLMNISHYLIKIITETDVVLLFRVPIFITDFHRCW